MKVAIFTDTYTPQVNGVAKTLERWTKYLKKQNIDYRLFTPHIRGCHSNSEEIRTSLSLPFWLYPECRLALPKPSKIRAALEAFQPDLIHIVTPFTMGLTGLYFGKKMDIPMVGSYHTHFHQYLDYYRLSFLSRYNWKYMRWFHKSFQITFVPSEETRRHLETQGFMDIKLWKRGVDSYFFHPYQNEESIRRIYKIEEPYILSYVGRLAREKGLDVLMQTAEKLPHSIKQNVHWIIVGNGPMYRKLKQNAPTNMTFTGYQENERLSQIYACSDLFVFPSATETFGNVVLESLASGTPAIVARSGGVQEIVQDGITGYLCEAEQSDSFVSAISTLLSQPALRKEMSRAARTYAQSQRWDLIFDQLLLDYQETVQVYSLDKDA
ncbi:glycosyltransferase family 4 protein [Halobacillus litoralis]|uniref:glycosyltransferase family 4 protein n=1 Tax=Halobacillus litoralis TaxID=45668 RepID=UPI001CFD1CB0|nr:glycosyltransferase family 1 protein [Halobacillus litoralis]